MEDADPAGGPLDITSECQAHNGAELLAIKPRFGIDQSVGPISEIQAHTENTNLRLGATNPAAPAGNGLGVSMTVSEDVSQTMASFRSISLSY